MRHDSQLEYLLEVKTCQKNGQYQEWKLKQADLQERGETIMYKKQRLRNRNVEIKIKRGNNEKKK